jgi:hypothetical protein
MQERKTMSIDQNKEEQYLSEHSNRRQTQRRSGHDQREMIRFELDKEDRRSGKERRKNDHSWHSNATI